VKKSGNKDPKEEEENFESRNRGKKGCGVAGTVEVKKVDLFLCWGFGWLRRYSPDFGVLFFHPSPIGVKDGRVELLRYLSWNPSPVCSKR